MRWYFDFISPFAYLQNQQLETLPGAENIEFKPVLFAGLLNHWGQLGPAELPTKRQWTFEHVVWLAHRSGIPLKLPAEHPFNPIPLLRLSLAAGNSRQSVNTIFNFVWAEGNLPQDTKAFADLCDRLGVSAEDISSPSVKQQLKDNGDEAIAEGVFGVPTLIHEGRLFWGQDATAMVIDFLQKSSAPANWPEQQLVKARELQDGLQRLKPK